MVRRIELRDIFNEDMDTLFAYRTPMLVNILDWRLGVLALLLKLGILVYIIVYVFVICKVYIATERANGSIISYKSGTALSQVDNNTVRVFDVNDAMYPTQDPGTITLVTKAIETPMQTRGNCVDKSRPCRQSSDCLPEGTCYEGYCNEASWCSTYNSTVHTLQGVDNFLVWFQETITFVQLATGHDFSTFGKTEPKLHPESGANIWTIGYILSQASTKIQDVQDTGAVFNIDLKWDCDVTWGYSCSPSLAVSRLDNIGSGPPKGFSFLRFTYYRDGGVEYRDQYNNTALLFVVTTDGTATSINLSSLILNISAALTLTTLVPMFVDFIMLNLAPNRRRYYSSKYQRIEGFAGETVEKTPESEPEEFPLLIEETEEQEEQDMATIQ